MGRKLFSVAPLVLIAGSGLLSGVGGTPVAPTVPAKGCPNASVPAAQLSLAQFDASVFCLINKRRAGYGRTVLSPNGLLQRAASDYAGSMEAGHFFSHYGDFYGHPIGATPISRLRQIGYIRPHYVWIVGENLHWTTGDHSTPAEVVGAWMASPIHRMYLLKRKFDELGVAAIRGTPSDPTKTDGLIVASEYGFRDS